MKRSIADFLSKVEVGPEQSHKNMTLYCLISANECPLEYLTLDEVLSSGLISIEEVSEGGSVPELRVRNRADRPVLLLDGEELVGAKQNRVLNATILIGASSDTLIPVSCVEQGRWSYRSRNFSSASRVMSPRLRRTKTETVTCNLLSVGLFRSNQGLVWDAIQEKHARMETPPSPTLAMADLYDMHKDRSEEFMASFAPVSEQMGMITFIDGRLAGIELFASNDTLRKVHTKMVKSYVMDALETADALQEHGERPHREKVEDYLHRVSNASVTHHPSVGLGEDLRLETQDMMGAGLHFEGYVLHLTIFPIDPGQETEQRSGSMRRASARRNRLLR